MFSDYGFVSQQDQLTRRFMAFGGRIQAGVTRHLMAKIRQQAGRPADALPCIQEAVAIFRDTGSRHLAEAEQTLQTIQKHHR